MDCWDFKRPRAGLRLGPLEATVDIEYPRRGLQQPALTGQELAGLEALCVALPGEPPEGPEVIVDAYTRGRDLVVTYAQTPRRTVRPQLYWRGTHLATEAGEAVGVELIFSMQTSLLESCPQASIVNRLPAGTTRRLTSVESGDFAAMEQSGAAEAGETGLFLFEPTGAEWGFALLIEPNDLVSASLGGPSERSTLSLQLFPESLEKGVIRRARLAGLWMPPGTQDFSQLAVECYTQFTREPLPLST